MHPDEAIGIAKVISIIQRAMLRDLDRWTNSPATTWNRDELLWKKLIESDADAPSGYRRTDRGEEVSYALYLMDLNQTQLRALYADLSTGDWQKERVERELRSRDIVIVPNIAT